MNRNSIIPDGSRVGACQSVSNFDAHQRKYPVKELLMEQMRRSIAELLLNTHVKETVGEFSTEYRMDVVVLSVDQFYGVVQKCAQAMYMRPLFSIDNNGDL